MRLEEHAWFRFDACWRYSFYQFVLYKLLRELHKRTGTITVTLHYYSRSKQPSWHVTHAEKTGEMRRWGEGRISTRITKCSTFKRNENKHVNSLRKGDQRQSQTKRETILKVTRCRRLDYVTAVIRRAGFFFLQWKMKERIPAVPVICGLINI